MFVAFPALFTRDVDFCDAIVGGVKIAVSLIKHDIKVLEHPTLWKTDGQKGQKANDLNTHSANYHVPVLVGLHSTLNKKKGFSSLRSYIRHPDSVISQEFIHFKNTIAN